MNFHKSNIPYDIKIFAISIFFLVQSNFLFAQKKFSDSTQVYDYWSQRGIIEVLYAYMNDYITTVTDSLLPKEKIKDCSKEKIGLHEYEKQFIRPLEKIGIEELSIKLDEVSGFLKNNNWSGAEKNVLQPLLIYLRDKNKLNDDFFSTLKPAGNEKITVIPGYSNKMINWNKTVSRIVSDYNEDLKKLKPNGEEEDTTSTTSTRTQSTEGDGGTIPPVAESQNWKFILLIGFLSFFIGMFITYLIIKLKIYHLLDKDKKTYKNSVSKGLFSFLSMISLLKKRKDDYKDKVTQLENRVAKLEKQLTLENDVISETNKDIIIDKQIPQKNDDEQSRVIEWEISKEDNNILTSYFSIPETDGRFVIEKGEQTNDGSKYYRIEYRNNSNEGNLFFISGNQDKRAINRLDSYLKPVCDIDNIINAENASKIEVLKNGKVIKKNGSWVIDPNHKVKIKLM
ncbi:MAG TPA: hypothetical protein P5085_02565 [Paludibacteraceae bacterium]|nr:hypothetical protein [Paludibacteraceae bacterium]HRT78114.1 hypothetical protein [Paludibacteraceae bacterium]